MLTWRMVAACQQTWPEFAELSGALRACWPMPVAGEHRIALEGGDVDLRLVFADAQEALPMLDGAVDAFYLDGFSPAPQVEVDDHAGTRIRREDFSDFVPPACMGLGGVLLLAGGVD